MLFKSHSDDSDPGMLISTMVPLVPKIKEFIVKQRQISCLNVSIWNDLMFSLISDKGGKYLKLVRKFLQTNNKFEPWQHN